MLPPLTVPAGVLALHKERSSSAASPPVFVVDDDAVSQLLVSEALADLGLVNPVVALFDGQAAIREFERLAALRPAALPGLVFLDWQMPGCDGIEVLRWMRHVPALRCVPVIMLSSDDSVHQVKQAYDLGASSYLVKPLAFSALGAVVRSLQLRWQIA